jgi:hypothetical protein
MTWTPKPTAPAHFSLADAFLALITGDAQWGWLVDWLTLLPNTGFDTAEFCAAGPQFADALVVTDFIPTFNPLDPRQLLHVAGLAVRYGAAARDRVFGAYCEQLTDTGLGTWGSETVWTAAKSPADGTQVIVNPHPFGAHPLATSVRVRMVSPPIPATSSQDYRIYHEPSGSVFASWNGGESIPTGYSSHSWTNGDTIATISFTIAGGASYGISWNDGVGSETHTPTPQPQPAGVTSPLRTVDPSLAGIAAELERLEFKLDNLWPLVQAVAGATLDLGGDTLEAQDVVADVPVDVAGAVGCVITTTGIPASRSTDFGTPQNVVKLAHLNCGTADAWYPSIWLTHSPFVLRPFPPGTTRITITDLPPGAASTIALIPALK